MRILYLDCFAGVSGDMLLGTLTDLGVSVRELSSRLDGLNLQNYQLTSHKTSKNGISGTKVTVDILLQEPGHRHLPQIINLINDSSLPQGVKDKSITVFRNLAEAEAKIHGISIDAVHFHEVGAVDAIIDIVGTVLALDILGVERIVCSPLPLGRGFVNCAHGTLPLPAPATLELLRGMPIKHCDIEGETVTPTGAALVKTLAAEFGPLPGMLVNSVGYGAGEADRTIPNLLRSVLGELIDSQLQQDIITVVEANIDDMNPEFFEHIFTSLMSTGALDVFITPAIMKKGRPGQILTCLVPDSCLNSILDIIFSETTTLGVRTYPCNRYKLSRENISVETLYGTVSVKLGRHPETGTLLNIAPEWEDCKKIANEKKVPVKTIYDLAKAKAYNKTNP